MKLGRELAELTAGLDALYRSHNQAGGFLDREGLIPVAVADVTPRPLRDYAEARAAIEALQARVPAEAESDLRRDYILEMTDSLLALVTTFEDGDISYADRLRRQIRIDTTLVPDSVIDGLPHHHRREAHRNRQIDRRHRRRCPRLGSQRPRARRQGHRHHARPDQGRPPARHRAHVRYGP